MNILAIETSCDETAVAIIQDGNHILSNVVVSQVDIFAAYGGVIPEVAARSHLEVMMPVLHQAFRDAHFITSNGKDDWSKIDAIAVTHTPGLLGSLLIGTLTARTLAILHNKPLYPIHHLKSHIYANWLNQEKLKVTSAEGSELRRELAPDTHDGGLARRASEEVILTFPLLALVVSGGHTQIIYMKDHNKFEIIGTTKDDAVGECFDKIAKILGLPYPGGPAITEAAKQGNPKKYKLPHPQVDGFNFSFSGLKTAVLRAVQKACNLPISHPSHNLKNHLSKQQVADFAASFQSTAVDILLEKLQQALQDHPDVKTIALAGGVAANTTLRKKTKESFLEHFDEPTVIFTNTSESKSVGSPACQVRSDFDSTKRRQNDDDVRRSSRKFSLSFPNLQFTGDNAAMVGAAAFYEIQSGVKPIDPFKLNIFPRSPITQE